MKTLQNKTVSFNFMFDDGSRPPTYAELIKVMLSTILMGEARTIGQMRVVDKALDVIDDAIKNKFDYLDFTEDQLDYIITRASTFQWTAQHKDLITFEDDLIAAK